MNRRLFVTGGAAAVAGLAIGHEAQASETETPEQVNAVLSPYVYVFRHHGEVYIFDKLDAPKWYSFKIAEDTGKTADGLQTYNNIRKFHVVSTDYPLTAFSDFIRDDVDGARNYTPHLYRDNVHVVHQYAKEST